VGTPAAIARGARFERNLPRTRAVSLVEDRKRRGVHGQRPMNPAGERLRVG